MSNILITGVAGMIGSRLADWIIQHHPDCAITGIDNLSGGYREYVPSGVNFIQADLATEDLTAVFEEKKFDYVFHLAAYAAEGLSPFIRKFNYNNNLIATANIVNECIRSNIKRLVFTSSMAVYGEGNPPFQESDYPSPVDPYGVAKLACEMDIRIAGEQHGLDWCIIRPHNVYGINQNIWDKYRNVLGIWMYQHLEGEPMTVFGDGLQKRAFSYVEDCMEPFWLAATSSEASKEIINLGCDKEHTIIEAAQLLQKVMNGGNIQFLEQRHEVKHAFASHQKAHHILRYQDTTSLEIGLQAMWNWAKNQPKRKRKEWDRYEIDKGMYQFWKK